MNAIEEYHKTLKLEIESKMLTLESGGNKTQLFTRYAIDLLKANGEVDNVIVAYDEETNPGRKSHKVNAFSISDDYTSVSLFVTIYKAQKTIQSLSEKEVSDAIKLVSNFYIKAAQEDYVNRLTDSAEIVGCAQVLGKDDEFKDNAQQIKIYILTNGIFSGKLKTDKGLGGLQLTCKMIDLERLCEMSEEQSQPIFVDFESLGYKVPCITGAEDNDLYQAYIAIVPGACLADLYETYKVRLMENNVRQFLQFTGKINKGIKETIEKEPEMFLAYNNGIAATASDIELDRTGKFIKSVKGLQIVNGGQTTASLYHVKDTNKDVDLSRILVQVKFSIVRNEERYNEIVANISRCANTQNKVSESDFSANREELIRLETWSRSIMTEPSSTRPTSTFWYFERAKGQYKNFRLKEGFTKQAESQFDMKYPKEQVFTKYDLAKYENCYGETHFMVKINGIDCDDYIGPHTVCLGNEKNYAVFLKHNMPKLSEIDNIYFEDLIAKAILFKEADKRYGTKQHGEPIGEIKKSVVPYAIALLHHITDGQIDLYKIWMRQEVSTELSNFLYELMKQINKFILSYEGVARYEELAKKKSLWEDVKSHTWSYNLKDIKRDLIDPNNPPKRVSKSKEEQERILAEECRIMISNVPVEIWERIALWGKESECLSVMQQNLCHELGRKIGKREAFSNSELEGGAQIIDILSKNNIDLLYQADAFAEEEAEQQVQVPTKKKISNREVNLLMTDELLRKMRDWDRTHHVLRDYVYDNLDKVVCGEIEMSFKMKWSFYYGLENMKARGFKP
jgi:hypothetical protein